MDWFRVWGLALVLGLLSGVGLLLSRVRSYEGSTGLTIDLGTGYRLAAIAAVAMLCVTLLVLGIAAVIASRRSRPDARRRRELTR